MTIPWWLLSIVGLAMAMPARVAEVVRARFCANDIEAWPQPVALPCISGSDRLDLILHVATTAAGIACGDSVAVLTAEAFEGDLMEAAGCGGVDGAGPGHGRGGRRAPT